MRQRILFLLSSVLLSLALLLTQVTSTEVCAAPGAEKSKACQQINATLKLARKHKLDTRSLDVLRKKYCKPKGPPCIQRATRFYRKHGKSDEQIPSLLKNICTGRDRSTCLERVFDVYSMRYSDRRALRETEDFCRSSRSPGCLLRTFRLYRRKKSSIAKSLRAAEDFCQQGNASKCLREALPFFQKMYEDDEANKATAAFCKKGYSAACLDRVYRSYRAMGRGRGRSARSAVRECRRRAQ